MSSLTDYVDAIKDYFDNPEGDQQKRLNGINAIHNLVSWSLQCNEVMITSLHGLKTVDSCDILDMRNVKFAISQLEPFVDRKVLGE